MREAMSDALAGPGSPGFPSFHAACRRRGRVANAAALLLAGACATGPAARIATPPPAPAGIADARLVRLPLALVTNAGQWPARVHFCAQRPGSRLWLESDAIVVEARAGGAGQVLRLRVLDAAAGSAPIAEQPLPGRHSFFLGDDPGAWRAAVPAFEAVRWPAIRPGIDLVLTTAGGCPEYLVELAPGARLADLQFVCEGVTSLAVRPDGSLLLRGAAGELVQTPPRAFAAGPDGVRRPVAVRFEPTGPRTFRFAGDAPAAGESLCIDPMLQWSTYVGGSGYEWGMAVRREADGTAIVVGETASSDFPTTAGAFDPSFNGGVGPPTSDVYVARIRADGTGVVYATYLGGSGSDKGYGLASNGAGEATVVGACGSANFPTTPGAYDSTLAGSSDAFVARLSADGATLLFSTLLGGSGADNAEAAAVAGDGTAWVVGVTSSASFPVTSGAVQSSRSGTSDAFVARVSADGTQLLAATLLGGADGDVAKGVAVAADPVGSPAIVGGVTSSADFPTTAGAMQQSLAGNSDAFLVRLSDDCRTLLSSTLCGGGGGDVGEGVAAAADGTALLCGTTSSNDFPVSAGAFDPVADGSSDAFVAGFTASGARAFATLVGGSNGDVAKAVSATPAGTVVVCGQCSSSDFPTSPGAVLGSGSGSADAFAAHLAADGSGLLAGTLFGGGGSDGGEDGDGRDPAAVALTGVTGSRDLPLGTAAWSPNQRGTNDAFAAVLDLRAPGIVGYGTPSPGCLGNPHASVTRWPAAGVTDFAFACTQAPPAALGFLVIGFAPSPGIPLLGITAWLDPTLPLLSVAVFADARGFARVPLPLAGIGAGTRFYAQFVWFDPPSCPPGLGASDALEVTVQ